MVRSAAGKPIDKPEKLWIIINIKKVSIVHPHAVARRDIERFFGLFTTSNPVINDFMCLCMLSNKFINLTLNIFGYFRQKFFSF